jgi:uncharacterized membrane protein
LTIQSNKTLGGVAAILTLIGAVSSVSAVIRYVYPQSVTAVAASTAITSIFGIFSFIGFILFLVAMYGFSRDYSEHKIFNYILYGIVITVIAAVVAFAFLFALVLVDLVPRFSSSSNPGDITGAIAGYLPPLVAVFGFISLIYVVANVKAFNLLGDKSEVPLFKSAAKVMLAGALLTIVLGLVLSGFAFTSLASTSDFAVLAIPGGVVQDIAWLMLALAFFRIKVPVTQTVTSSYGAPTYSGQIRYCTHCGAANTLDSGYCTKCGQKL